MGGSVFGMTMALANLVAVMGVTARSIAPRRRCTCESNGFLTVIVFDISYKICFHSSRFAHSHNSIRDELFGANNDLRNRYGQWKARLAEAIRPIRSDFRSSNASRPTGLTARRLLCRRRKIGQVSMVASRKVPNSGFGAPLEMVLQHSRIRCTIRNLYFDIVLVPRGVWHARGCPLCGEYASCRKPQQYPTVFRAQVRRAEILRFG